MYVKRSRHPFASRFKFLESHRYVVNYTLLYAATCRFFRFSHWFRLVLTVWLDWAINTTLLRLGNHCILAWITYSGGQNTAADITRSPLKKVTKKKKKKSGFVATNTAVDVTTSCPKCLLFVTPNTAGDGSKIHSKAANGVRTCWNTVKNMSQIKMNDGGVAVLLSRLATVTQIGSNHTHTVVMKQMRRSEDWNKENLELDGCPWDYRETKSAEYLTCQVQQLPFSLKMTQIGLYLHHACLFSFVARTDTAGEERGKKTTFQRLFHMQNDSNQSLKAACTNRTGEKTKQNINKTCCLLNWLWIAVFSFST